MDLDEIKELMAAFAASDLAEMHLTHGEWMLHLVRSADGSVGPAPASGARKRPDVAPSPAPSAPASDAGVRAPLAGFIYLSPAPGASEFVTVGRRVEAGEVVAIIEAMKVFNEIRADLTGTVEAICVASGEEVEAGQLLMRIV